MMLSVPRRRTRNFLLIALILSVIIHLIGGGLWGLLARALNRYLPKPLIMASLQEPAPPKPDIIRLERPVKAAARQAHENRVVTIAPHPHPVAAKVASPLKPRHELAHLNATAPAQPPPSREKSIAAETPRHVKIVAAAPVPDAKPALSDRQIAQYGAEFSKTIADSRETLADVQAASEKAPVVATVKHYTMHFSGIHEGMNPGDGDIYVVSSKRIGDEMWYHVRYTYMYADGTYEADEVPWPVHYPIGDDPFARHDKRVPIQPPPEGYKPDHQLKPILQQFFGGPPVTG